MPDKIHMLNVSFTVNGMVERPGGTAGNIAYALSLLGEKPVERWSDRSYRPPCTTISGSLATIANQNAVRAGNAFGVILPLTGGVAMVLWAGASPQPGWVRLRNHELRFTPR